MSDWAAIRQRYLQDDAAVRMGGIAANLARIRSFSKREGNRAAVDVVMQESRWFIEWAAPELSLEAAGQLVELQVQLALWRLQLDEIWADDDRRAQVSAQAGEWSDLILAASGLMDASAA